MLSASSRVIRFICLGLVLAFPLSISTVALAAIEKSPNDPKHYRDLTLNNQLRVLLISKPDSDKAAASMNVAVGSSANPKDRAGLAHFLEHMLFLGTEKYPQADEYQSFIRSHGGGHNAYTSQENTNYFFDVSAEHLEPALDRFAQFFVAPLFDAKYVDRERHAVHSEYQAKIKDDYRRGYAVTKSVMNQANSHNWFAVGSLETLADRENSNIRDELISFYKQYYSANLMTLVVLGKEPLDQLEQMVRNKFSAVKNQNSTEFTATAPLFVQDKLPQLVKIKSVKDIRRLTLTFPIAETRSHWRSKPVYYISNLIGYEGKGSLLSYLKEKGWASSLSASQGHNLANQASFMVSIELTELGQKHYLDVTQSLFQFVERLKTHGLQEALYKEEQQLSEISFRFQEQSEPIHLVSGLSSQMQYYPTEVVISAQYKFEKFEPELIKNYLNQIKPQNMFMSLKAQSIEGNQLEPYYNASYSVTGLRPEQINALAVNEISSKLQIRSVNPYVAQDLTVLTSDDSAKPSAMTKKPGFEHWYMQDTSFNIPKGNAYFTLQTPLANQSAINWVLTNLYTSMLQEQLNETLYDAYLAGLSTQIYPHMKGFTVRLSGYNDKLPLLMNQVIQSIQAIEDNPSRFAILKQEYKESLANELNDKPYNQTTNHLYELLLPQWPNQEQASALETITLSDLHTYATKILSAPKIKLLTHGNFSQENALALESALTKALLKDNADNVPSVQVVQVPEGKPLTEELKVDHNDSALSVFLQGENNTLQARAEVAVLSEILAAPFYNQIRTEKQLGYIVFASPLQMHKTPGIAFIIQSPAAEAGQLVTEVNSFLTEWQSKLAHLDEEAFDRYKNSILSRILRQDNKLSTRTKRFWRELDWEETEFNTRTQLAEAVKKLSLKDIERCFEKLQQRRLDVLSNGKQFVKNNSAEVTERPALVSLFKELKDDSSFVPES